MLPHVLGTFCWCRPHLHERDVWVHRHLLLTYDPIPRATMRLSEGAPV